MSQPPPSRRVGARLASESRAGAVRARFVREVLARVPLERLTEVHLFAPMRHGRDESGVAVVVAVPVAVPVEDEAADDVAPDSSAPARHTLSTARYLLTVRGPDRGRWQFDLREEADAPLDTIDAVVRGVQRRVGDARGPERLSAAECARVADTAAVIAHNPEK